MATVHADDRPTLPVHVLHGVPFVELHVAEISFYSGEWVGFRVLDRFMYVPLMSENIAQ